ncbi:hypothetical protein SAMN05428977_101175 [Nitrosomonas sp. Nm166]|nr:hypothetical protein SAMN05428977_101175 [Nitrosomonas sp. Nm166]
MAFWGVAVAIFSFLLGINIKEAFEKNISNPNRITGITDVILLLSLFAWLLAYLYTTWFETKGMSIVFTNEKLSSLGVNISFLLMAFSLAVFFAVIIAYHNKILVVCVMAILLGVVDTYGNYNLMGGMLALATQASSGQNTPFCAEKIWYYYYLKNPQLQRILIYMAIAFIALMLSIYRERIKDYINHNIADNLPKYLIIIAIILNESTMLSWRIEREDALTEVNKSYYFQWSPYNVIQKTDVDDKTEKECPVSF